MAAAASSPPHTYHHDPLDAEATGILFTCCFACCFLGCAIGGAVLAAKSPPASMPALGGIALLIVSVVLLGILVLILTHEQPHQQHATGTDD